MMGNRNGRRGAAAKKPAAPADNGFSLISNQKLIDLYAGLLKCRMAEERAEPRAQALNGRSTSFKGREAGAVATTIDLGADDRLVFLDYVVERQTGDGWLPSSVTPVSLPGLTGQHTNGHQPNGSGSNGAGSKTVARKRGAQQPGDEAVHAIVGAALAQRTDSAGKISVVLAHNEAQPVWQQALHIAVTHSLPIVFVHQPRGRANSKQPKTVNTRRSSKPDAKSPYLPSIMVDTSDTVAIYRVASEAISRARKGRGPTLIECRPFQVEEQSASSPKGRTKRMPTRKSRDPIVGMEQYLLGKGLFHPEMRAGVFAESAQNSGAKRNGRAAGAQVP